MYTYVLKIKALALKMHAIFEIRFHFVMWETEINLIYLHKDLKDYNDTYNSYFIKDFLWGLHNNWVISSTLNNFKNN